MPIEKYPCTACNRIRTAGWFYPLPVEARISERPVSLWCKTCFRACGESLPPEGSILYELDQKDEMKKVKRVRAVGCGRRGPIPKPRPVYEASGTKKLAECRNYGRILTSRERRALHMFSLSHFEARGYYASMAQKQRYLQSVVDRPDPHAPGHTQVAAETPPAVEATVEDLFATPRFRPDLED